MSEVSQAMSEKMAQELEHTLCGAIKFAAHTSETSRISVVYMWCRALIGMMQSLDEGATIRMLRATIEEMEDNIVDGPAFRDLRKRLQVDFELLAMKAEAVESGKSEASH